MNNISISTTPAEASSGFASRLTFAARRYTCATLPIISIILAIVLEMTLPRSYEQKVVAEPWFSLLLLVILAGYIISIGTGRWQSRWRDSALWSAPFLAGVVLFFNIYNILTAKLALLPVLYFPAPDRILAVFPEDPTYLLTCMAYSYRLLLLGWFFGATVGIVTGY